MVLPPALFKIIILFMILAAGYLAGKLGILGEESSRGLSKLLANIILPALIVSSMTRAFDPALQSMTIKLIGISFLSYALAFALAFAMRKIYRQKGTSAGAHLFGCIFSNCAFLGFPVVEVIFGKDALFFAAIANIPFQLLAFSVGPIILAGKNNSSSIKISTFFNPAAIAALLGLIMFWIRVQPPQIVNEAFSTVGNTTTPLSMILIGSILARMKLRSAFLSFQVIFTSVYRLALFPALLFLFLYFIGVRGVLLSMPVVLAAMPVAVNSAILAQAYGGDAETSSALVLVSTLLSIVTIPVLSVIHFAT